MVVLLFFGSFTLMALLGYYNEASFADALALLDNGFVVRYLEFSQLLLIILLRGEAFTHGYGLGNVESVQFCKYRWPRRVLWCSPVGMVTNV